MCLSARSKSFILFLLLGYPPPVACVHGFMPSVSIFKIQVVPRLPFHVHDRDQVRYLRQRWLGKCEYPEAMKTIMDKVVFLAVIFGLVFWEAALAQDAALQTEYDFFTQLGTSGKYELYWSFNDSASKISFAVRVQTTGWVGFGVSPFGGMNRADVIIGWVNETGTAVFHDRFAETTALPEIDPSQDWTLTEGSEASGWTVLKFERLYDTGDTERDHPILRGTTRLIFSWNDAEPAEGGNPDYHGNNRGTQSINLFGMLQDVPDIPPDAINRTFLVNNILIPPIDTTYWCTAFDGGAIIGQKVHHIIGYDAVVQQNSSEQVHHIVLYHCEPEDFEGLSVSDVNRPCSEIPSAARGCLARTIIAAWAVGGLPFYYPNDVSYSIGGPGSSPYFIMQMHYDNPRMLSGVVDSSGIIVVLTETPRQHDAGLLLVGQVLQGMFIPPRATNYSLVAECPSDCTSSILPSSGITFVASLLHTHEAGRGLVVRQFRDGNEIQPPVDINLNYDFDYQQINIIPRRVLLPSDRLIVECFYDNVHNVTIIGGESTQQEMCFGFMYYYPRLPITGCYSTASSTSYKTFLSQQGPETQLEIVGNLSRFGFDLKRFVDNYPWSDQQYTIFQNSLMAHQTHFCRIPREDETASPVNLEDLEGGSIVLRVDVFVLIVCAVCAALSLRTA